MISCNYSEKKFQIKNEQFKKALDSFIKESDYKTDITSKKITINLFIYSTDTILYFERVEPYKIEHYKDKGSINNYEVFLYSDFKNESLKPYFEINNIDSTDLRSIRVREIDVAFKKGYKLTNGKLIENYDY